MYFLVKKNKFLKFFKKRDIIRKLIASYRPGENIHSQNVTDQGLISNAFKVLLQWILDK